MPMEVLDRTITAMKAFHEQPAEVKASIYRRKSETGVVFFSSSSHLLPSDAACWRDTLRIRSGPILEDKEEIPEVCRNEVMEWNQQTQHLGAVLMGLLSEGLGLSPSKLQDMTCVEKRKMLAHYYPCCPQPDLTMGLKSHTDTGVITVVLREQAGGLQVKHGEAWLDATPSPGVLIVNIGNLLQVMSNGEYKSAEHRVLANPGPVPRLSVSVFYYPLECDDQIGPIPELVSPEKPAAFQQFNLGEYLENHFRT
ncbi:1-aminocyclopropane-1-carboxylate oxidase homolog 1-like [Eucalyptus grandis]|uniref:1-aminocyclopropane-1-carboxylate oxidase homolog 1-like n=1 Tax=Eucalyptus grandis TaxID=71139 RepID=UPI0008A0AC6B|nr:1-aminocyclopropane-1-carboxylate oxidase homolog 1-like [Eucalyptus grandis]